jgi:hypothetical protein
MMDDETLMAFLNVIRNETDIKVGILDPLYRNRRHGFQDGFFHGDLTIFETAIMPIHLPNSTHWVLAIYQRNNVVQYYDSYLGRISAETRRYIKSAVSDITNGLHIDPQIIEKTSSDINLQSDGVNYARANRQKLSRRNKSYSKAA